MANKFDEIQPLNENVVSTITTNFNQQLAHIPTTKIGGRGSVFRKKRRSTQNSGSNQKVFENKLKQYRSQFALNDNDYCDITILHDDGTVEIFKSIRLYSSWSFNINEFTPSNNSNTCQIFHIDDFDPNYWHTLFGHDTADIIEHMQLRYQQQSIDDTSPQFSNNNNDYYHSPADLYALYDNPPNNYYQELQKGRYHYQQPAIQRHPFSNSRYSSTYQNYPYGYNTNDYYSSYVDKNNDLNENQEENYDDHLHNETNIIKSKRRRKRKKPKLLLSDVNSVDTQTSDNLKIDSSIDLISTNTTQSVNNTDENLTVTTQPIHDKDENLTVTTQPIHDKDENLTVTTQPIHDKDENLTVITQPIPNVLHGNNLKVNKRRKRKLRSTINNTETTTNLNNNSQLNNSQPLNQTLSTLNMPQIGNKKPKQQRRKKNLNTLNNIVPSTIVENEQLPGDNMNKSIDSSSFDNIIHSNVSQYPINIVDQPKQMDTKIIRQSDTIATDNEKNLSSSSKMSEIIDNLDFQKPEQHRQGKPKINNVEDTKQLDINNINQNRLPSEKLRNDQNLPLVTDTNNKSVKRRRKPRKKPIISNVSIKSENNDKNQFQPKDSALVSTSSNNSSDLINLLSRSNIINDGKNVEEQNIERRKKILTSEEENSTITTTSTTSNVTQRKKEDKTVIPIKSLAVEQQEKEEKKRSENKNLNMQKEEKERQKPNDEVKLLEKPNRSSMSEKNNDSFIPHDSRRTMEISKKQNNRDEKNIEREKKEEQRRVTSTEQTHFFQNNNSNTQNTIISTFDEQQQQKYQKNNTKNLTDNVINNNQNTDNITSAFHNDQFQTHDNNNLLTIKSQHDVNDRQSNIYTDIPYNTHPPEQSQFNNEFVLNEQKKNKTRKMVSTVKKNKYDSELKIEGEITDEESSNVKNPSKIPISEMSKKPTDDLRSDFDHVASNNLYASSTGSEQGQNSNKKQSGIKSKPSTTVDAKVASLISSDASLSPRTSSSVPQSPKTTTITNISKRLPSTSVEVSVADILSNDEKRASVSVKDNDTDQSTSQLSNTHHRFNPSIQPPQQHQHHQTVGTGSGLPQETLRSEKNMDLNKASKELARLLHIGTPTSLTSKANNDTKHSTYVKVDERTFFNSRLNPDAPDFKPIDMSPTYRTELAHPRRSYPDSRLRHYSESYRHPAIRPLLPNYQPLYQQRYNNNNNNNTPASQPESWNRVWQQQEQQQPHKRSLTIGDANTNEYSSVPAYHSRNAMRNHSLYSPLSKYSAYDNDYNDSQHRNRQRTYSGKAFVFPTTKPPSSMLHQNESQRIRSQSGPGSHQHLSGIHSLTRIMVDVLKMISYSPRQTPSPSPQQLPSTTATPRTGSASSLKSYSPYQRKYQYRPSYYAKRIVRYESLDHEDVFEEFSTNIDHISTKIPDVSQKSPVSTQSTTKDEKDVFNDAKQSSTNPLLSIFSTQNEARTKTDGSDKQNNFKGTDNTEDKNKNNDDTCTSTVAPTEQQDISSTMVVDEKVNFLTKSDTETPINQMNDIAEPSTETMKKKIECQHVQLLNEDLLNEINNSNNKSKKNNVQDAIKVITTPTLEQPNKNDERRKNDTTYNMNIATSTTTANKSIMLENDKNLQLLEEEWKKEQETNQREKSQSTTTNKYNREEKEQEKKCATERRKNEITDVQTPTLLNNNEKKRSIDEYANNNLNDTNEVLAENENYTQEKRKREMNDNIEKKNIFVSKTKTEEEQQQPLIATSTIIHKSSSSNKNDEKKSKKSFSGKTILDENDNDKKELYSNILNNDIGAEKSTEEHDVDKIVGGITEEEEKKKKNEPKKIMYNQIKIGEKVKNREKDEKEEKRIIGEAQTNSNSVRAKQESVVEAALSADHISNENFFTSEQQLFKTNLQLKTGNNNNSMDHRLRQQQLYDSTSRISRSDTRPSVISQPVSTLSSLTAGSLLSNINSATSSVANTRTPQRSLNVYDTHITSPTRSNNREPSYPSLSRYRSPSNYRRHYLDSSDDEIVSEEILETTDINHYPTLIERWGEKPICRIEGELKIEEVVEFEETEPTISEEIVYELVYEKDKLQSCRQLDRSRSESRNFRKIRKRRTKRKRKPGEDSIITDTDGILSGTVSGTSSRQSSSGRYQNDSTPYYRNEYISPDRSDSRDIDDYSEELTPTASLIEGNHTYSRSPTETTTLEKRRSVDNKYDRRKTPTNDDARRFHDIRIANDDKNSGDVTSMISSSTPWQAQSSTNITESNRNLIKHEEPISSTSTYINRDNYSGKNFISDFDRSASQVPSEQTRTVISSNQPYVSQIQSNQSDSNIIQQRSTEVYDQQEKPFVSRVFSDDEKLTAINNSEIIDQKASDLLEEMKNIQNKIDDLTDDIESQDDTLNDIEDEITDHEDGSSSLINDKDGVRKITLSTSQDDSLSEGRSEDESFNELGRIADELVSRATTDALSEAQQKSTQSHQTPLNVDEMLSSAAWDDLVGETTDSHKIGESVDKEQSINIIPKSLDEIQVPQATVISKWDDLSSDNQHEELFRRTPVQIKFDKTKRSGKKKIFLFL
ncbi:unnamed protein product [Didymodactylos carnosus]|uniref:Uncharacterized protein n=1 Tax=Didymodactylos carnosus TaxID=1234261 RepID=A0A813YS40_9BILA|nr:unnamed protein product [Didymodactylos carnosus]CAF3673353.1 unnamed protein product [Didymodactylos carnosus]